MSTEQLDRKDLKRPDAFLARANSIVHFINHNAKLFVGLLALLLAVGIALAFFAKMREQKAEAANNALYGASQALAKANTTAKPAVTDPDWEAKSRSAFEQLARVGQDYPKTAAAFDAWMTIGNTYFEKGNTPKAIENYKKAVENAPNRSLKAVGSHALGYAYENAKEYDQAIDSMRQVVATDMAALKADSILAIGRIYELKGDKAKALEQYTIIEKDFPNSGWAKIAEAQKASVK